MYLNKGVRGPCNHVKSCMYLDTGGLGLCDHVSHVYTYLNKGSNCFRLDIQKIVKMKGITACIQQDREGKTEWVTALFQIQ